MMDPPPAPEVPVDLLPPEPLPPELAAGAAARRNLIRAAARRSLPRRRAARRLALAMCGGAAAVCLVPLVTLGAYVVARGLPALGVGFLIHSAPAGIPGAGIANAIAGSMLTVGLGAAMAAPLGILAALFLLEHRGPLAAAIRLGAGVATGAPSIAVGIVAYALLVEPLGHFSALAGGAALGVLMLPIVIRSAEAAMAAVPVDLREAAVALGARRSRVARSVVLRGALGGLVTGGLLAVARAVGETAPLLFTAFGSVFFNLNPSKPMAETPLVIFSDGTSAFPGAQQIAWGTALVLLVLVLALSIAARVAAARLNRGGRTAGTLWIDPADLAAEFGPG